MEAKGLVKTTVKKTVTVNNKEYELSCIAFGQMTAPVTHYTAAKINCAPEYSSPREIEVDYSNATYEWVEEEWDYDNDFEFNFKNYEELTSYLETVKKDLLDEVYRNFAEAEVMNESYES